jgi:hypothetical protein
MKNDKSQGKSEDGITQNSEGLKRRDLLLSGSSLVAASALLGAGVATTAHAQQPTATPPTGKQPNIVVIMGDDIGIWNIGAYHQGMMAGRTPNLDKLAAEACASLTTTPRQAVRPVVPPLSPASCRSAQA